MIFSYLLNMQSHPSWVCGLKLMLIWLVGCGIFVTPFVGVWIETVDASVSLQKSQVTPFVGVWIETVISRFPLAVILVTPFVGVWIETT